MKTVVKEFNRTKGSVENAMSQFESYKVGTTNAIVEYYSHIETLNAEIEERLILIRQIEEQINKAEVFHDGVCFVLSGGE